MKEQNISAYAVVFLDDPHQDFQKIDWNENFKTYPIFQTIEDAKKYGDWTNLKYRIAPITMTLY